MIPRKSKAGSFSVLIRVWGIVLSLILLVATWNASASQVSGWPVPYHDPSGTNAREGRGILRDPSVLWRYTTVAEITAPIVTAFGQLVTGTRDGTILFLDVNTGEEIDRISLGDAVWWIGVVGRDQDGDLRVVVLTRADESASLTLLDGRRAEWEVQGIFLGSPTFATSLQGSAKLVFGYVSDLDTLSKGLALVDLASGRLDFLSNSTVPVTPPRLGDLDRDGLLEIASLDTSGRLTVIREDGETPWARDLIRQVLQAPIIADFTCDGYQEILVPLDRDPWLALPANLSLYDRFGALVWSRTYPSGEIQSVAAVPLQSTSCRDVAVSHEESGIQVLEGGTGNAIWTVSDGALGILGVDLEGDGRSDVLAIRNSGATAFNGSIGDVLWELEFSDPDVRSAALYGLPSNQVRVIFAGGNWILGVGSGSPSLDVLFTVIIGVLVAFSIAVATLVYWRWRIGRKGPPPLEDRNRKG
ncbi:MAG: PQQ-binding-like beta-propeller repeat protein [Thermoplasmata archaeon]